MKAEEGEEEEEGNPQTRGSIQATEYPDVRALRSATGCMRLNTTRQLQAIARQGTPVMH